VIGSDYFSAGKDRRAEKKVKIMNILRGLLKNTVYVKEIIVFSKGFE
jgi:hypothetical protein